MSLRKEQIVLLCTLFLLGFLLWGDFHKTKPRVSRGGGKDLERADHPAPDLDLAAAQERDPLGWSRDLFAQPSDTRPLPPLELQPPPLPPLEAVFPPPEPGPEPALYGRLLRASAEPTPILGLFAVEEEAFDLVPVEEDDGGLLEQLADLGGDPLGLAAAERAAQIESWKRLYDWIKINEATTIWGQIRNPDRYGLSERVTEAVLFVEVLPETGAERFPQQDAVSYARERVLEFAFADSIENRIRLRRREIGDQVSPGQFPEVLAFARWCVDQRLETRDALPVAEDLFRLLAGLFPEDVGPRLGLTRCLEAGFRLEEAWGEYRALLSGGFSDRPEVHVRLAQLEARLRLFESARARFAEAERKGGRTLWEVQWPLGRFLYDRGEYPAALEHLEVAYRREPTSPEQRTTRVGIRNDYGAALLAVGRIDEALNVFDQALGASPEGEGQRALAGARGAVLLGAAEAAPAVHLGRSELGFDLLVSESLEVLRAGVETLTGASEVQDMLEAAAGLDPLRAHVAWRGLSWLAETTGYPGEALAFAERAYESDPTDAWTLYQRARLLAAEDDQEGARASFMAALDREIDFADALVSLGQLALEAGEHADAERYFERAVSIDPDRATVHSRRGLNLLQLGDLRAAEECFQRAMSLVPADPVARAGMAWVLYREGDAGAAIQALADLDDLRRSHPEDDPYRLFAAAQMERIQKHVEKVVWTDPFERRGRLRNNWNVEGEDTGVEVSLLDGTLAFRGAFSKKGELRVFRQLPATDFISIEAEIRVEPRNNARTGIFAVREQAGGRGRERVARTLAGVWLSRHRDGPLQTRLMESADRAAPHEDQGFPTWPKAQSVLVRIERVGEGNTATGRMVVDGFTVLEGFPMKNLASTTSSLAFGIFVEGETGRWADVRVEKVEVVHVRK